MSAQFDIEFESAHKESRPADPSEVRLEVGRWKQQFVDSV